MIATNKCAVDGADEKISLLTHRINLLQKICTEHLTLSPGNKTRMSAENSNVCVLCVLWLSVYVCVTHDANVPGVANEF